MMRMMMRMRRKIMVPSAMAPHTTMLSLHTPTEPPASASFSTIVWKRKTNLQVQKKLITTGMMGKNTTFLPFSSEQWSTWGRRISIGFLRHLANYVSQNCFFVDLDIWQCAGQTVQLSACNQNQNQDHPQQNCNCKCNCTVHRRLAVGKLRCFIGRPDQHQQWQLIVPED